MPNKLIRAAVLVALVAVTGCQGQVPPLSASGPFAYPSAITPPLERVAILVTITNRGSDDVQVNPADFIARDAEHRIYPSDTAATTVDANLVRLATGARMEALPLPTVLLRQSDVLSGFVVFDVPRGVQPTELVWRQADNDQVARLIPGP